MSEPPIRIVWKLSYYDEQLFGELALTKPRQPAATATAVAAQIAVALKQAAKDHKARTP